jgi:hypothetical protein
VHLNLLHSVSKMPTMLSLWFSKALKISSKFCEQFLSITTATTQEGSAFPIGNPTPVHWGAEMPVIGSAAFPLLTAI